MVVDDLVIVIVEGRKEVNNNIDEEEAIHELIKYL